MYIQELDQIQQESFPPGIIQPTPLPFGTWMSLQAAEGFIFSKAEYSELANKAGRLNLVLEDTETFQLNLSQLPKTYLFLAGQDQPFYIRVK